jgi:DNA-binding MarR family transcriptional regulator
VTHYLLLSTDYLNTLSLLVKESRRQLHEHSCISLAQFRILDCLCDNASELTVKELIARIGLSPSAMSARLKALEERGLITRHHNPANRRTVITRITSAGLYEIERSRKLVKNSAAYVTKPLGAFLKKHVEKTANSTIRAYGYHDEAAPQRIEKAIIDAALVVSARLETLVSRETGLSLLGFRILLELTEHSDGIRCNELAKRLIVQMSDITATTSTLVRYHYINREDDPLDKRALRIDLTSSGYELIYRLAPTVDAFALHALETQNDENTDLLLKAIRVMTSHHRRYYRYRPSGPSESTA